MQQEARHGAHDPLERRLRGRPGGGRDAGRGSRRRLRARTQPASRHHDDVAAVTGAHEGGHDVQRREPAADDQHSRARIDLRQAARLQRVLDNRRVSGERSRERRLQPRQRIARRDDQHGGLERASAGGADRHCVARGDGGHRAIAKMRDRRPRRRPLLVGAQRVGQVVTVVRTPHERVPVGRQGLWVAHENRVRFAPAREMPRVVGNDRVRPDRAVQAVVGIGGRVRESGADPLARLDDGDRKRHGTRANQLHGGRRAGEAAADDADAVRHLVLIQRSPFLPAFRNSPGTDREARPHRTPTSMLGFGFGCARARPRRILPSLAGLGPGPESG